MWSSVSIQCRFQGSFPDLMSTLEPQWLQWSLALQILSWLVISTARSLKWEWVNVPQSNILLIRLFKSAFRRVLCSQKHLSLNRMYIVCFPGEYVEIIHLRHWYLQSGWTDVLSFHQSCIWDSHVTLFFCILNRKASPHLSLPTLVYVRQKNQGTPHQNHLMQMPDKFNIYWRRGLKTAAELHDGQSS